MSAQLIRNSHRLRNRDGADDHHRHGTGFVRRFIDSASVANRDRGGVSDHGIQP